MLMALESRTITVLHQGQYLFRMAPTVQEPCLMFKGIYMSRLTCMSQWYLNLKLQLPGNLPSIAAHKQRCSKCWFSGSVSRQYSKLLPYTWQQNLSKFGLTSWWKYAKQMWRELHKWESCWYWICQQESIWGSLFCIVLVIQSCKNSHFLSAKFFDRSQMYSLCA